MKKKTINRIRITVALIIAMVSCSYMNKKDAEYEKRVQESEKVGYIVFDGEHLLISLDE